MTGPSLRHRLIDRILKWQGYPERFATMVGGSGLKRHPVRARHRAREKAFDGFPFHWFEPPGERERGIIIALHGGGYIAEAQPPHWDSYARLAKLTGRRVYAPSYPLAPEHAPETIRDWTRRFIAHVQDHLPGEPLVLTGDSAGANLALLMVADGVEAERLLLWSPWVDLDLSDADTRAMDGKCRLLSHGSIDTIADAYIQGHSRTDGRWSPIHAERESLPPTLVLSGDHDLLHPSISRWVALRQGQGEPVEIEVADGMFHDWVILPTPEGRRAISRSADFLTAGFATSATP